MADRGKQFEEQFKKDWKESMPDSFCYRLHDQVTGYKVTSRNPCDFICYKFPYLYLLEIKSHEGNTFPFSAFRQYDEMIKYCKSLQFDGAGHEMHSKQVKAWKKRHPNIKIQKE